MSSIYIARKIIFALASMATACLWAQPVITSQPTNATVLVGGNAMFSVGVAGPGPFTYQWTFNGTNLSNNIITTLAGTNSPNFAGDGGPATSASLNRPAGVATDNYGELYFADLNNSRIRFINSNGIIATVAGSGNTAFSGDAAAAPSAGINSPYDVCMDA